MKKRTIRLTALLLAVAMLLTSCGGNSAEATTMKLAKTEGTVGVSDGEGKDVTPADNLGLYSGYQVATQAESYAWIDLDSVKLTKMDADSEIEITKDGKKLEINVLSGSLFFNITEPLADDETLDIRTSSMVIGIRGTCGWVTQDAAALLDGSVEIAAGEQAVTITAGEMAVMTADGELEVRELSDIPAFVLAEIESNEELTGAVPTEPSAGTMPADHVMDWRDEALAAKMAEITGITDREIMLSDVWELDYLSLADAGIHDISVLGELTNLRILDLSYNNISDISALSGLTSLQNLILQDNSISDISALSGLTSLQNLILQNNSISDISALSGLTNLQLLDLARNNISDVSPLSSLTNLQQMQLNDNNISNVSALSGLTNLTYLNLGGNNITDYSPVQFVPDLVPRPSH